MKRQLLSCCAILAFGVTGAAAGDLTYGNDYVYAPESSSAGSSAGIIPSPMMMHLLYERTDRISAR